MTPKQLASVADRNELRIKALEAGLETDSMLKSATDDITSLLVETNRAIAASKADRDRMILLQRELAEAQRATVTERNKHANCMHTVNPLRDKLAKARSFLSRFTFPDLNDQDKEDLRDIRSNK